MNGEELEVKYYIADLAGLEQRVRELGAVQVQERVLEVNLRFDTPDSTLSRTYQALRLRQDQAARMTYKGPSVNRDGVRLRPEYEFEVSDFAAARALLEALGYRVVLVYEKYRATYDLDEVHITLDELPYGHFAELEGPHPLAIQSVSDRLELDWEQRIGDSYTALFQNLRQKQGFTFRDLTFDNFRGKQVTADDLGVRPADL